MALILNIETTTRVCSVALALDGILVALKESRDENYSHSENLVGYIKEVFSIGNISAKELDAIAVSMGPGSYTGLRIGVSISKGLCYALEKPLIAIETLKPMAASFINQLMAQKGKNEKDEPAANNLNEVFFVCPMLDARRMEVYCSVYDNSLNVIKKTSAEIIDENSFSEFLKKGKVCFIGEGSGKCKGVMEQYPNACFYNDIFPSAQNMITFSEEDFKNEKFADLAYFEPFYLKNFIGQK